MGTFLIFAVQEKTKKIQVSRQEIDFFKKKIKKERKHFACLLVKTAFYPQTINNKYYFLLLF